MCYRNIQVKHQYSVYPTELDNLFPNLYVERDMTRLFICILYANGQRDSNIAREGMDPREIWRRMGYHAFGESIISAIVDRLINNGITQKLIRFESASKNVVITGQGIRWCERINCRKILGVFNE